MDSQNKDNTKSIAVNDNKINDTTTETKKEIVQTEKEQPKILNFASRTRLYDA